MSATRCAPPLTSSKTLVPIRVENAVPKGGLDYLLGNVQWLSIDPENPDDIAIKVESVTRLIDIEGDHYVGRRQFQARAKLPGCIATISVALTLTLAAGAIWLLPEQPTLVSRRELVERESRLAQVSSELADTKRSVGEMTDQNQSLEGRIGKLNEQAAAFEEARRTLSTRLAKAEQTAENAQSVVAQTLIERQKQAVENLAGTRLEKLQLQDGETHWNVEIVETTRRGFIIRHDVGFKEIPLDQLTESDRDRLSLSLIPQEWRDQFDSDPILADAEREAKLWLEMRGGSLQAFQPKRVLPTSPAPTSPAPTSPAPTSPAPTSPAPTMPAAPGGLPQKTPANAPPELLRLRRLQQQAVVGMEEIRKQAVEISRNTKLSAADRIKELRKLDQRQAELNKIYFDVLEQLRKLEDKD